MDLNSKDIQLQYQGYLNTALLWKSDAVFGMHQFQLSTIKYTVFNEVVPKNLRLGKLVERFVSMELRQDKTIKIHSENPQIQNDKITVGEMDCIFEQNSQIIHLEVVYKFYLYEENAETTEIEQWIGPNRKDSLLQKLEKLKTKQLPLLYSPHTKPFLESLNLNIEEIRQYVLFKAQLFLPWGKKQINFSLLNEACVKGFYINFLEMKRFNRCKFFIPTKKNWLMEVQTQTDWLTYKNFLFKIMPLMETKTSPMCWIKFPNGQLEKFFVVWW